MHTIAVRWPRGLPLTEANLTRLVLLQRVAVTAEHVFYRRVEAPPGR